jgi:FtsZ-binding cell division protein ZapB
MKKATPRQIIYLITLIIILASCNSEKRLARKEERSWDTYSTSPRLVQRSVPLVKALYPSAFEIVRSDTTFLPDSIPYPVVQTIPVEVLKYKNRVIDTLLGTYSLYVDSLGIQIKYLGKPQIITKTIKTWHTDTKEVDRLNDSLNNAKVEEANLKGQIAQLEKDNAEVKSEKKKSEVKFYALIGLIAIVISVIVFVKVKTKLPL